LIAIEVWGHRVTRYTVGPFAHLALLGMAVQRVRTSRLARLFLVGHALAGWALAREARRMSRVAASGESPEPLGAMESAAAGAGQVLFLQAVALGGVLRYLRGDRRTQWSTVER
jgi:hypothetical protein